LDIDAREALMQALNNYQGAVILVSHDPHLVEHVADRLWLVADGTCKSYDDDLDAYRNLIVQQRRKERSETGKKEKKKSNEVETDPREKELQKLEAKLAELITRKDAMDNEMAAVCEKGDAKQMKRLSKTYDDLQKEIAATEKLLESVANAAN
jgi:ATP-binding cassette subfamily F protein 3